MTCATRNSGCCITTNKTFHAGPFRLIRFTVRTEYVSDNPHCIEILDVNKKSLTKISSSRPFKGTVDIDISAINQQVFLQYWIAGCSSTASHSHPMYISKIEFIT